MTRHILIIEAHPDGRRGHLCGALADAYAEGAETAGHTVRRLDLATIEFPLLRSREEFENRQVPAELAEASEAIQWAEHIVFIFPLWFGTMPALLKAFFEQALRPGIAFAYRDGGGNRTETMLLAGCSARIIVTMGMPAMIYRFWFLAHGVRGLRRSILNFVGIRPVRETYFGRVEQVTAAERAGWLARARLLGGRGI